MSNQEQKPDWKIKPDATHWSVSLTSSVGVFYKETDKGVFVASELTNLEWIKAAISFDMLEIAFELIDRPLEEIKDNRDRWVDETFDLLKDHFCISKNCLRAIYELGRAKLP